MHRARETEESYLRPAVKTVSGYSGCRDGEKMVFRIARDGSASSCRRQILGRLKVHHMWYAIIIAFGVAHLVILAFTFLSSCRA